MPGSRIRRARRASEKVVSGYAGGAIPNPSYEQICSGRTGHAEVVQVAYDPGVVSYEDLLGVFFTIHDPTTLNRQGNDIGTQYRSAIFYHDEEQKAATEKAIHDMTEARIWSRPIVTESRPAHRLLRGRGVPSGLFQEQPVPALLPGRRRPQGRQVPQAVLLEAQEAKRLLARRDHCKKEGSENLSGLPFVSLAKPGKSPPQGGWM